MQNTSHHELSHHKLKVLQAEGRFLKYHLDQPCCQRRARQSRLSHTSQKQHSGLFLYTEQQIIPFSDRGCSHVSSPSQVNLWEGTRGYIYDSVAWDEGGPKMEHEENITNEPHSMFQVSGFHLFQMNTFL